MALSFDINRSQFALFCQVDLEDKLTLAAALRNADRARFDGDPVFLPSVPDAPPEIPGIILQSRDGNKTLSVSSSRVDATASYDLAAFADIRSLMQTEAEFLVSLAETLSSSDQVNNSINRVGMMVALSANLGDSDLAHVRQQFLRAEFGLGQNRLELGFLDRQQWETLEVNRWFRATAVHEGNGTGSLEIVLDFNTVPQADRIIAEDEIMLFLETLKSRADEEIKVINA